MSHESNAAPQVTVFARWSHRSQFWMLQIVRCPFCGKPHEHGGGNGEEPELGRREAHCASTCAGRPANGYELVLPAPVPIDLLRAQVQAMRYSASPAPDPDPDVIAAVDHWLRALTQAA